MFALLLFIPFIYASAQTAGSRVPLVISANAVQYKNYYLLTLLQQDKAVNTLLLHDATLIN